jgi:hypothetical protein
MCTTNISLLWSLNWTILAAHSFVAGKTAEADRQEADFRAKGAKIVKKTEYAAPDGAIFSY